MSRPVLTVCALFFVVTVAQAADPKPVWEIEVPGSDKATAPRWIGVAPNGQAIAAVLARETGADPPAFTYTLRVWDSATRKERFNADLGRGRTRTWNDDLAAFSGTDTILTGGSMLAMRNLETGSQSNTTYTGGVADHTVWAVPDLGETFALRREPERLDRPIEIVHRTPNNRFDDFRSSRIRGNQDVRVAEVAPPREGLRAQAITLNPGRTRLVAAFRDDGERPRHALVLYSLRTIEGLELEVLAEATNPHPGSVGAVAFAHDGKTLATGGEDGSVCLWNVRTTAATWQPRATVTQAGGRVVALAFSPDWRTVAAVTWDKTKPNLLLIDADSGTLVRAVRIDREPTGVTWSADGRMLITGACGGKIRAWDAAALLKRE